MNGKQNTQSKGYRIDWEKAQELQDHWKEHLNEPAAINFIMKQEDRHGDHKKGIAIWTVQYLINLYSETGMTIFLDTGSTVEKMTEYLLKAIIIQKLGSVSVVTNSMVVFDELNDWTGLFDIRLILTGGEFDRYHQSLWGNQTIQAMQTLDYNVVAIGTCGISFKEKRGVYVHTLTTEAVTKEAFLKKETDYRIILADYSKIGDIHVATCAKPMNLLEGIRRQCLIVTTTPPQDDEVSWRRFEEETVEFEELCRSLNKEYSKELLPSSAAARELRLVVVNPQNGEEDKRRSRSSKDIAAFTTEDFFKDSKACSTDGEQMLGPPSDTEDSDHRDSI